MRQDNSDRYNRDSRSSGGYNDRRSGGHGFNNRSAGSGNRGNFNNRSMHSAVCDECGQTCEVPFRPTSGKPVYCDNCFSKNKNRGDNSRSERHFDSRASLGNNRSFDNNRGTDNNQSKMQLDSINMKLDQILQMLKPVSEDKSSSKEKEIEIDKVKKIAKKVIKKSVKKVVKKSTKKVVKKK